MTDRAVSPVPPPDPHQGPTPGPPRDPDLDHYLAGVASLAADPSRWPRELADLTDYLADELVHALPSLSAPATPDGKASDVTPAAGAVPASPDPAATVARCLAGRLVARIAREYGGTTLYLPKGLALDRTLRDLRIWAEYDGTVAGPHGIEAIARREGISTIYVYRILAAQRDLHRRQRQPDLFADPAGNEVSQDH